MKPILSLFSASILASILVSFSACGNESSTAHIIEVNKKMPLIAWPDSAYIASLEEILAMEPVKKGEKNKPSIAMNSQKAPTFMLPQSVTGQKGPQKGTRSNVNKGEKTSGKAAFAKQSDNSAEAFMDKFSRALSALQSDPSNAGLYKVVEAKDGEDLFKLLKRTYGAGSQNLPRFYVLSTLQSVNAGVALEHLNAGDKVRVPRL